MLHVEVSTMVEAPPETVLDVYADWSGWPRLFPTISGVRLLRREGAKLVLEVDHVEGKVINELVFRRPDQLELRGEIHLKGWARLLQPFLRVYARRQMQRQPLQPVKAEAEARARQAAEAAMRNQGRCRSAE